MPPRESNSWLASARVHVAAVENPTLDFRLRCFHGQRAVEMSLKAVLIHHGVSYPFTHELDSLMELVPGGVPDHVIEASRLTPHAVQEMYPDTFTDLGADHADEAVELARAVIEWATAIIEPTP